MDDGTVKKDGAFCEFLSHYEQEICDSVRYKFFDARYEKLLPVSLSTRHHISGDNNLYISITLPFLTLDQLTDKLLAMGPKIRFPPFDAISLQPVSVKIPFNIIFECKSEL